MSRNIFGNNPPRPDTAYNSKHFRPEPPFILCAAALASFALSLAGIATANKLGCAGGGIEFSDVVMTGNVGPMLGENAAAIGVDFAELHGSHAGVSESETEPADSGKEIDDIQLPLFQPYLARAMVSRK